MPVINYQETLEMQTEVCCNCGIIFGVPLSFHNICVTQGQGKSFYCPNGHGQSYTKSDADKIREEYEKKFREKENEIAQISSAKIQLENQLVKSNRDLKRLKNGVCPCCNRSFHNLQQHIANEHPELIVKEKQKRIYKKIKNEHN